MMKRVDWQDYLAIEQVAESIKKGDVVAGTSDTVIGLLAAATVEGKAKLDQIKQRTEMPYLVLVPHMQAAQALSLVFQAGPIAELARAFWPGPLTLIVPAAAGVSEYLQSSSRGIAVRVPNHAGLQELLAHCGMLFSTSANLSGHPVPERFSDIDSAVAERVSFFIGDEGTGAALPSTIIDCTKDPIHIVREGAISKDLLSRYV